MPPMPTLFAVEVSVFEPTAVMLTTEAFTSEPLPTKALEPPPMFSVDDRPEKEAPPPLTSDTVGTARCGVREATTSVPFGAGTLPPGMPAETDESPPAVATVAPIESPSETSTCEVEACAPLPLNESEPPSG